MRVSTVLAILMMVSMTMSGCLGFGGDDEEEHTDECHEAEDHDACHAGENGGNGENGGTGNETTVNATPNAPPVANLTMYDMAGNMLNESSYIMAGDTIRFSANGSFDPEDALDLAALTVVDGDDNVRTVNIVPGEDVTMNFTAEGRVLAALRLLDAEGESGVVAMITYVNLLQTETGETTGAAPAGQNANNCAGPTTGTTGGTLVDQQFSAALTFSTRNGTRWISASTTANVEIAICDPSGERISNTGKDVSTEELEISPGVDYYVYVVNKSPNSSFSVDIIVHWEPKPAA